MCSMHFTYIVRVPLYSAQCTLQEKHYLYSCCTIPLKDKITNGEITEEDDETTDDWEDVAEDGSDYSDDVNKPGGKQY